ncbi:MAG: alpha/beta fold hydrolase [Chitinophagales bacterium]|jgi:pimeloyl-ACP methyl ester carboxylesterase|nr:alpha/beta hydrolase [Sphingobacteriales bacterium]
MKIYAISGLGANELVFKHLEFPDGYEFEFIPWILPYQDETIQDYAKRMAEVIDDKEEFILLGLSFGGMIAQEIARIKNPKKLLLFNTVRSHKEKPLWIRINTCIKLYKYFPYSLLNDGQIVGYISRFTQFLNSNGPDLSKLYSMRENSYTRWAFEQVAHWERTYELSTELYRFHGMLDIVFPIWNIQGEKKVLLSGHLAVYVQADKVNKYLRKIL